MKVKRETKQCVVCGAKMYRTKHTSDFSWSIRIYCEHPCQALGSAISRLQKLGYDIKPKYENNITQTTIG